MPPASSSLGLPTNKHSLRGEKGSIMLLPYLNLKPQSLWDVHFPAHICVRYYSSYGLLIYPINLDCISLTFNGAL